MHDGFCIEMRRRKAAASHLFGICDYFAAPVLVTCALFRGPSLANISDMKKLNLISLLLVGTLVGCASKPANPDVKDNVRTALDSHGWKDVSVAQDRDKGVVTLTGHVPSEAAKNEAASLAQGIATNQVVANEIVVTPPDAGN